MWSRAAPPLFARGSETRQTAVPWAHFNQFGVQEGNRFWGWGQEHFEEQSLLPSLESTPSLGVPMKVLGLSIGTLQTSPSSYSDPHLAPQHLSPGSTLSSARLLQPFALGYKPHFQSCPCLYLFSSSKWARIRSSSPLSSILRLPGTCWLPPGSLSVMGLEWRSRYWSSSLLQQVEKHL